jgi:hypothetical protein
MLKDQMRDSEGSEESVSRITGEILKDQRRDSE